MPHIVIVSANFYPHLSAMLIAGTERALAQAHASCEVVTVPGVLEIPPVIRYALQDPAVDGFVALGCVIRGETTHYDWVWQACAHALMDLQLEYRAAIGTGVLTVEDEAQAIARADPAVGDKGGDAARACLSLLALRQRFSIVPTITTEARR